MTTEADLIKLVKLTFDEILRLRTIKGKEYAQENDALSNFRSDAEETGLKMEAVWQVFALKHWRSVMLYIANGDTSMLSEPIEARIDDLILYLILLKAIIRER